MIKVGSELPIKGENAESWKSISNNILSFEKNIIISILVNKKEVILKSLLKVFYLVFII